MATELIATDEFRDWFDSLSYEEQKSVDRYIEMLEDFGTRLPFPYIARGKL
jgi:hypothetical protein